MTRVIGEFVLFASGSLALSLLAKATLIMTVALVAHVLARRCRASLRHLLLATMFPLLMALPIVMVTQPPVDLGVSVEPSMRKAIGSEPPSPPDSAFPVGVVGGEERATVHPATAWPPSGPALLMVVWSLGVVVAILPLISGLARIRELRRSGMPWAPGKARVAQLAAHGGIAARTRVLLVDALAGPMTCGAFRPVIVLPPDATGWAEQDLRRALIHELEHIRRHDWLTLFAARIVCAVYWFHPLVWFAWRRLRLDAERACDDIALREGTADSYAEQLVNLAQRVSRRRAQSGLAMANRGDLPARVSAVLDERQARGRIGVASIVMTGTLATALLATVAPLRAVGVPKSLPLPQVGPATSVGSPAGAAGLVEDPVNITLATNQAMTSVPAETLTRPRAGSKETQAAPNEREPSFDAASVRSRTDSELQFNIAVTPGRFRATNVSLLQLLLAAFPGYQANQFVNAEGWIKDAKFDVEATFGGGDRPSPEQLASMMRTLLEDRFSLEAVRESRSMDAFELVALDGVAAARLSRQAEKSAVASSPLPLRPGTTMNGVGRLAAVQLPISRLSQVLSARLGRPVLDRTGIEEPIAVDLTWAPGPGETGFGATSATNALGDRPSLSTALQEQAALTLRAVTTSVDVVVVRNAARPAAN